MIGTRDPATMPYDARLAEVAQLLARAWIRARVRATSRPVAKVRQSSASAHGAARERSQKALADQRENEALCVPLPDARDFRAAAAHGEHR